MVGELDHLAKVAGDRALRARAHRQAGLLESRQVMVVDLVAMAMALGDRRRAVDAVRERARHDLAGLRAEAHRAAEVRAGRALLDAAVAVLPLGDQRDDRVRRVGIELGRVRVRERCAVTRVLDHGQLHAEADAEVRDAVLARVADRLDLALDPTLAVPSRHQDRIHAFQGIETVALDRFRIDVVDLHFAAGVDARMGQRLRQRLVRFGEIDILADHRNVHVVLGVHHRVDQLVPHGEIRGTGAQGELAAHDLVQPFGVQRRRDLVDRVGVERGNHCFGRDIGEERDLAPVAVGQRPVGTAHDDVGLDTDLAQLLD